MNTDVEQAFLDSVQFKGAVDGAREGMALWGYTASDDTIQTIALSVLIRFIGAGGYEIEAVEQTMAMVLSVTAKMQAQSDARPGH
jgi:hypothetical protein